MNSKKDREKSTSFEILLKKNIIANCKWKSKEEVIDQIGQLLYESGYVNADYTEAMLEREKVFSTNIGNGIALPHGIEEAKDSIKKSGIAIMLFPGGTCWGEEEVTIVIGVAGVGDEHLEILGNIANKLSTPEAVKNLVKGDVDMVYQYFMEEE
ncbi:MAG: PTS sugar transporter subunit IIA [Clostridiales bacterium]|nr:PTS sugar transporter subunit IIA [Clostridiales bacterium]